jgi:splicing factor 3B subunit 2
VIYSDDDQLSDSDADDDGAREAKAALSKRKLRRMQRLTVAELKQMVPKPELVEGADVTANDPRLLLQLKATRNAVPVPPHWSQKRAYLQNKRGVEKPPYLLPGESRHGAA